MESLNIGTKLTKIIELPTRAIFDNKFPYSSLYSDLTMGNYWNLMFGDSRLRTFISEPLFEDLWCCFRPLLLSERFPL